MAARNALDADEIAGAKILAASGVKGPIDTLLSCSFVLMAAFVINVRQSEIGGQTCG
jgi:hypothetical protein